MLESLLITVLLKKVDGAALMQIVRTDVRIWGTAKKKRKKKKKEKKEKEKKEKKERDGRYKKRLSGKG